MSKRNPFEIAEKVGNVFVIALVSVAVVGSFIIVGWVIADYYKWGWWGLTLVIAVPVAFFLLGFFGAIISAFFDWLGLQWRLAKFHWDDKHKNI